MHSLRIATVVIVGFFSATAQAADDASPIVGSFPDTASNMKQVLFKLKDNDISESMSGEEFCKKLDYGEAVLSDRPDEIKDHTVVPGKLNWVICRFKNK